jgi:CheY-like chemotaxis protein
VPRLLVVEDERKLLKSLQRGLEAEGYSVVPAANGDDAQSCLARESFGENKGVRLGFASFHVQSFKRIGDAKLAQKPNLTPLFSLPPKYFLK